MDVPKCMCCSTPIRTLDEVKHACPSGTNGCHLLSIHDSLRLGEKFSGRDLMQWLGPDWKAEVAKIGRFE